MKRSIKILALACMISLLAVPVFAGRGGGSGNGSGHQYKYKNNSGRMTQTQTRQQKQSQYRYQKSGDRLESQTRSMTRSHQRTNNIDSAIARSLNGNTTN